MIPLSDNIEYFAFTVSIMVITTMVLNLWLKQSWLHKATVSLAYGTALLMLVELIVRTMNRYYYYPYLRSNK